MAPNTVKSAYCLIDAVQQGRGDNWAVLRELFLNLQVLENRHAGNSAFGRKERGQGSSSVPKGGVISTVPLYFSLNAINVNQVRWIRTWSFLKKTYMYLRLYLRLGRNCSGSCTKHVFRGGLSTRREMCSHCKCSRLSNPRTVSRTVTLTITRRPAGSTSWNGGTIIS